MRALSLDGAALRRVAVILVLLVAGCSSTSRAEKLDAKGRREKKPQIAIDLISQAIELEPQRADFWLHRGDARAKQGDMDGAIADYTESIRLEASARTHLHRARARRAKKLFDLALADISATIELDPDYEAAAEKERTKILQAMGDREAGRERRGRDHDD
jgi:tetratricopeptide (TPR) repeat protein